MAFKNEERRSHIISTNDIFRKICDDKFENLINEIKDATIEDRINIGRNTFVQLIMKFQFIWDETESEWVHPLVLFLNVATQIGCYGRDNVTSACKNEILSYFQDVEPIQKLVEQRDDFFDYNELRDEDYQKMVTVFLAASLEPLTSDYPNILFTYMICVACADMYNKQGIALIEKMRNEYFEYAPLRKEGKVEDFIGTIK